MSDDRLPQVIAMDNSIIEEEDDDNELLESAQYSWYDGQPNTAVVQDSEVISQRDCRTRGGIATGCNAKMWQECQYGKKPKESDQFCYYLKFTIMCEKITDSSGKELN